MKMNGQPIKFAIHVKYVCFGCFLLFLTHSDSFEMYTFSHMNRKDMSLNQNYIYKELWSVEDILASNIKQDVNVHFFFAGYIPVAVWL